MSGDQSAEAKLRQLWPIMQEFVSDGTVPIERRAYYSQKMKDADLAPPALAATPAKPSASDEGWDVRRGEGFHRVDGIFDGTRLIQSAKPGVNLHKIAKEHNAAIRAARTAPPEDAVYLKCAECSKPALRYSSTMDGLRCQSCGAAYVNCKQVERMLAAPAEDTKRLDWLEANILLVDQIFRNVALKGGCRAAIDAAMNAR